MVYRFLKLIIGFGISLFYREIRVKNREALDHDGPKIILANHPNTLMDAWMIGHVCREPIFYMAKATFFNTRFKIWVLRGLGLIPINRATESKTKRVSNNDSFEHCYRLLEKGKTLVIFPEGNSFNERQLRMLKSGAARIALEVEKRNKEKSLNLRIIPVGLVYSQPEKFRSSVLVNIGDPVDASPLVNDFEKDSLKTARALTDTFRQRMEDLLVGATSTEHEVLVEDITHILSSDYVASDVKGVEKDVSLLKKTFEGINRIHRESPERMGELTDLVYRIKYQLQKYEIKSGFLDRNYKPRMFLRQLIFSTIFLILGLPLYMFGVVHNVLQYKLVDIIVSSTIKDREYFAAVSVLLSLVVYPISYFGFIWLFDSFVELTFLLKLVYFACMPLLGLFAWFFHHYLNHVSFKTNYLFLMTTQKDAMLSLAKDRERLREILEQD